SGTPTADSALILSPTRSVSSLRARDPNLKSFRSILALKSNTKRIEAFRYAREEAARVDMGLDSWIQATLAANPEHADLVSSTGAGLLGVHKTRMPQRNLSARTFDKIASSGHVRQISGGGLAHLVHSQQAHVHVKGKDLLHSAGGAAKGLFSRGKHRFKHGVSAEAN
ncbi:Autophagy protein 22, partial [Ascosphaera pollenicola]